MVRCPICEKGALREIDIEEKMFGISLGKYRGEICNKCGETFVNSNTMKKIEEKAKSKKLWGLTKKLKIVKTGNSLAIRIPANIAKFLNLKEGKELLIRPEQEKIIIELI